MVLSIAIVGAGPSAVYCAEALKTKSPDARIDVLDRLPTPYGLVRAGVAPDHQGTKAITRVFDRIVQKPGVRFLGNVTVGGDVTLDEIRGTYDAVVLATGATLDRRLGIPGEDLAGVIGSGAFVFWYNGHPDHVEAPADLAHVRSAVVIGNGNVAIDVARVLAKTPAEMSKSDIAPHAAAAIRGALISEIHIVGRRGPVEANFTFAELSELGRLGRCAPVVDAADLPADAGALPEAVRKAKEANLATLRAFAAADHAGKPLKLRFHFHAAPVAIIGRDRVEAVRFQRAAQTFELPADLVVTCIGYRCATLGGDAGAIRLDDARGTVSNVDGRVAGGLYAVGWAKRGPSGVIATNRPDSHAVADRIIGEVGAGSAKPGPDGLDRLLSARGIRAVSFGDWLKIDAVERAAAKDGAPRAKLVTFAELLAAAAR